MIIAVRISTAVTSAVGCAAVSRNRWLATLRPDQLTQGGIEMTCITKTNVLKSLLAALVLGGLLLAAAPQKAEARRWVYYPGYAPAYAPVYAPGYPVYAAPARVVYRSYYTPYYAPYPYYAPAVVPAPVYSYPTPVYGE
jgi:hypothetical protein